MPITVTQMSVRWDGVPGATGYEVKKDGVVVGSRGQKARTTSVNVDTATLVEIVALPDRDPAKTQGIYFEQAE